MKKLIVFAMLAGVLFFATNGVLAVVQEASQRSNREAYATLEAAIAAKREALSALNSHLDALSQQIDRLQTQVDDLEHQMADIKNIPKNRTMPNAEIDRYNALVDQHNALVQELNGDLHESEQLTTQIRAAVNAYNHDIENANTLAQHGMTRSLLIPGLIR